MHTGARVRKQKYIMYLYISLYMKTFLKTGVYICFASYFADEDMYRRFVKHNYVLSFIHSNGTAFAGRSSMEKALN